MSACARSAGAPISLANFPVLLAWVEQGGTVIAQYNRPNGLRTGNSLALTHSPSRARLRRHR